MPTLRPFIATTIALFFAAPMACTPEQETPDEQPRDAGPEHEGIYSFAGQCVTVDGADSDNREGYFLNTSDGGFAFDGDDESGAEPLFMEATDLGTYLFYDRDENYLVVDEEGQFLRQPEITSDAFNLDDNYLPGVQFEVAVSDIDDSRFQLRHLLTGQYLSPDGLVDEAESAGVFTFHDGQDCADYPRLTLDASGQVRSEPFEDGSVFGIVDTHSHIMSNWGFGGAGIYHGAAFHPFGVEHALPSCEHFHGEEGRQDLFGYGYDQGNDLDEEELILGLANGETPEFNHHTAGYPEFTDWPNAHSSSTHQTQYYRWLERAYRGGLRMIVQHATSNEMICDLVSGTDTQPTRYDCSDMTGADRTLREMRKMERYIDAQHGGPEQGWLRIVESPEEAREVINDGKLAIVLGFEVSNLFDCYLVPRQGQQPCTEEDVVEALDHYHDRGVRVLFPVHKFDNGFSAGDGHRELIEIGNFAHTGHWSNFTDDCPDLPTIFDDGDVAFSDLNQPRDDYFAEPPNDMSGFADDPFGALFPHLSKFSSGPLEGDYCQNHGLTDLGEFLILEMMKRGMILEIDHFPRRSYQRVFELLEEYEYPAAGTHANNNRGELYALGGISKMNFGRCSDPDNPGGRAQSLRDRVALIVEHGGFPAEGFGFDFNGFAGAQGPRFGDDSVCGADQPHLMEWPFTSYGGGVTFTQPQLGERTVDYDTEGMAHIGLMPELIQDVRNDGATDADLEPLFKSAEGYLRMWELAEARADALADQLP